MDYILTQDEAGGTARLTTESPRSSYGIPVLRVDTEDLRGDFGPAERIGTGAAADVVAGWAREPDRTPEEIEAARAFLGSWPEGPQV